MYSIFQCLQLPVHSPILCTVRIRSSNFVLATTQLNSMWNKNKNKIHHMISLVYLFSDLCSLSLSLTRILYSSRTFCSFFHTFVRYIMNLMNELRSHFGSDVPFVPFLCISVLCSRTENEIFENNVYVISMLFLFSISILRLNAKCENLHDEWIYELLFTRAT